MVAVAVVAVVVAAAVLVVAVAVVVVVGVATVFTSVVDVVLLLFFYGHYVDVVVPCTPGVQGNASIEWKAGRGEGATTWSARDRQPRSPPRQAAGLSNEKGCLLYTSPSPRD